ncbi:MAG: DUF86 domain-containing protein [Candidatus Bathyarchaeia archaeon]
MAKLSEYLTTIDGYLNDLGAILESVRSPGEFTSKPREYYATLHLLQLSIQSLIDMSSRLISLMGAKKPEEYGDIADILNEEKVLNDGERETFRSMIKFRSLLIHVYTKVSPDIVYRIAKERAERDIKNIAGKILKAALDRGVDP